MSTLHDRLSDLADAAPTGAPTGAAPGDLWVSGRRLDRRRRLGTAVAVATAAALVGGLAGLSWSRSDVDVQPAGPRTELGFPDRFYLPSERLPGTDDTGPIGPLSALLSGHERPIGISATGEYAFLDLPTRADRTFVGDVGGPAINADGTKVAYWREGRPSGEPLGDGYDSIVGVNVYDTVSGDVVTFPVPTEHGLQDQALVWAGDTLWFEVWQNDAPRDDGSASGSLQETVAWNPADDSRTTWDRGLPGLSLWSASAWDGRLVGLGGQGALRFFTHEGTEVRAEVDMSPRVDPHVVVSDDGRRLAALEDTDGPSVTDTLPQPLLVGELPDRAGTTPAVAPQQVPGTADQGVNEVLGWRDDSHVVAMRYGNGADRQAALVSVDVVTGEQELLAPLTTNTPELAADALEGPLLDAPPPPDPLDPRLVYGGIAAILLGCTVALVWWRRRVQR